MVRQSLGALATAIGAQIGREVTCSEGMEEAPSPDAGLDCRISVMARDRPLPRLAICISREMLGATQPIRHDETEAARSAVRDPQDPGRLLLDEARAAARGASPVQQQARP